MKKKCLRYLKLTKKLQIKIIKNYAKKNIKFKK